MDNDKITKEQFEELAIKAEAEKRQCIVIFQDTDGNWRGGIQFLRGEENPIFVRAVGPDTVLQELLTHAGK